MKVLFITNIPSPYRVDFFNELGKGCELTVLFEKQSSDERDDLWKDYRFDTFKGVFLKGVSIGPATSICFDVKKHLTEDYDVIICSNFTSPTGLLAVRYMKRHDISYYLECDGGFAKNGKGFKERIKRYTVSGASGYFSTGRDCDNYYLAYGADLTKILRYPFSSAHDSDIADRVLSISEKKALRKELGLSELPMVLCVGQFIHRKGIDILLKAVSLLPFEVTLCCMGGTPTQEYLDLVETLSLKNVIFKEFMPQSELKRYYQASDIFVLPTREDIWGLVINEAIANGLPVISTDKCSADKELICDGKNGYIVPTEDFIIIADRITKVLSDTSLAENMSTESLMTAREYTIEHMATRHLQFFERV